MRAERASLEAAPASVRGPAGCALALAFALGACRAKGEEAEPAPQPKAVHCMAVHRAEITDQVELRGAVAPLPDRDAQVAPQVPGRVVRVFVREGDAVKAGQMLAQIDDAPLRDELQAAQAAEAKLRAERELAEITLARMQRVFDHGIAARQEVDDAAGRSAAARAAEAEAIASRKRAELQLERAAVKSPLAGVVLKLLRRPGELVDGTPATPIVEVGDPSELELVADAPAQDLVRVQRGGTAAIGFSALPGLALTGRVSAVAPAVDRATGLGIVRIAIDRPAGTSLPIGAYGSARVATGAARQALLVPASALRSPAGDEAELLICGSVARTRKVKTGARQGEQIEIASGLADGESIVLSPVLGVADGDPLKVEP